MTGTVLIEIAAGELIDKITILEIKSERIEDTVKRANVMTELATMTASRDAALPASPALSELTSALKAVNETLWQIEDDIRECDRAGEFGERFTSLARAVYRVNDQRAGLKREINILLGSRLIEEKSYQPY